MAAPMTFDWAAASGALENFGGERIALRVPKTGLPFFDALQLYGAIDLYVGLREETSIHDAGSEWQVGGVARHHRLAKRPAQAFKTVWKKSKPAAEDYCAELRALLVSGHSAARQRDHEIAAIGPLQGLDAALQAGIRDTAASKYETLETGQTSTSTCCVAKVPLRQGLLAFAGKRRTETVGQVVFLPLFEGPVDFGKIVSPLRAWLPGPNLLCAQAVTLLSLRASLFAEGYEDRLTGVVFTTAFDSRRRDNCSGLVGIASTAIGRIKSGRLAAHLARVFRSLVGQAWTRGRTTSFTADALATALWLMQPTAKHLTAMVGAQEHLHAKRKEHFFARDEWAREVFAMTYGDWQGDHEAVRALAKATASAIYFLRMAELNQRKDFAGARKAWYDEVVMIRCKPSPKAFVERVLTLLEQGHREHSQVGTHHRNEAFDPRAILASIGRDRGSSFETFRDLFRMYLLQESTSSAAPAEGDIDQEPPDVTGAEPTSDLRDEEEE